EHEHHDLGELPQELFAARGVAMRLGRRVERLELGERGLELPAETAEPAGPLAGELVLDRVDEAHSRPPPATRRDRVVARIAKPAERPWRTALASSHAGDASLKPTIPATI